MTDIVIRFPASKRKFTKGEEQEIRVCSNLLHNVYNHDNPFVTNEHKMQQAQDLIAECVRNILKMNED
jgi:hypothetical protein